VPKKELKRIPEIAARRIPRNGYRWLKKDAAFTGLGKTGKSQGFSSRRKPPISPNRRFDES